MGPKVPLERPTVIDTIDFYEAGARGATVVVPGTSTAKVSRYGLRSSARDHTIVAVKEMERRRWKRMARQLRFMQQRGRGVHGGRDEPAAQADVMNMQWRPLDSVVR